MHYVWDETETETPVRLRDWVCRRKKVRRQRRTGHETGWDRTGDRAGQGRTTKKHAWQGDSLLTNGRNLRMKYLQDCGNSRGIVLIRLET